MSPIHHPSAQALANLLIGDCSPGAALLVGRHLVACPQCAARVQAMGAVGAPSGEIRCDAVQLLRPGVQIARVQGVSGLGEAVFQLRAEAAATLSIEEPFPIAELLVVAGGLSVDGEPYAPGDFLSVEETRPSVLAADAQHGCELLITCLDADGVAVG